MNDNVMVMLIKKYRPIIVLGIITIFFVLGFWWFYGHGRITMDTVNAPQSVTFTISDGSKTKPVTQNVSNKPVTKTFKSGPYQVLVKQADKSYWTNVTIGHFLLSKSVKPQMEAERERTFVGKNPASCMQIVNNVLVSYTCGGTADTLKVHMPATSQLPSFTKNPTNGYLSQVEGIVTTKNGTVFVSKQLEDIGLSSPHTVTKPDQAADLAGQDLIPVSLKGLQSSRTYVAVPYQDGFVMYDQAFQDIQYFSDPGAQPKQISMPAGKKADIPVRFDADGQALLAAYSNTVGDADGSKTAPITELVMYKNDQLKRFSLSGTYLATILCGKQYICALDEAGLKVYDASGSKLKELYAIPNVRIIGRFASNGLLFLQDRNVINLDIDKGVGYIAYSLGNYQLNGITGDASGALLNLTNSKGAGAALQLGEKPVDSAIDKQLDTLLHSVNISDASVYGNYLFVNPNLGELVYVPSIRTYDYPPEKKRSVNDAIQQDIKASGIDTTKYIVVNPYAR